jgi:DNA primase large subunit
MEDFETFALDRLRILAEIESSLVRNRPYEELKKITLAQCKKYLDLNSNSAITENLELERRKDHIGHFVLRLAFCKSWVVLVLPPCPSLSLGMGLINPFPYREELRRRFLKAECLLFRIRYDTDDTKERAKFLSSRDFDWTEVTAVG